MKLLYANGCSFTNMPAIENEISGLRHPELHEQWPDLLAKKLSIPECYNHGLWGGSNYRIIRTTRDFLETTPVPHEDIFVVIAFSFVWRFEMHTDVQHTDFFDKFGPHTDNWVRLNPGWVELDQPLEDKSNRRSVALLPDPQEQEYIRIGAQKTYAKVLGFDRETEQQECLLQILALQGLLDHYKVKHKIIFGTIIEKHNTDIVQKYAPNSVKFGVREEAMPHLTVDNYHADHKGHEIVAQKLFDLWKSDFGIS